MALIRRSDRRLAGIPLWDILAQDDAWISEFITPRCTAAERRILQAELTRRGRTGPQPNPKDH